MTRLAGEPTGWHRGVELKSEREIAVMRQAGRIVALAIGEMQAKLKPGITGRQLDAIAEKVIAQNKAEAASRLRGTVSIPVRNDDLDQRTVGA